MLKLFIVGTIAVLASAFEHPVNEQIVSSIRNSTSLWQTYSAETNPFRDYTKDQLLGLVGTIIMNDNEGIADESVDGVTLPENFDSRQQWPKCIHEIRDQQKCGSCWAFGASEVLSDRFCIASKGAVDVILSPQNMVSCDGTDKGCNGGILKNAWLYLVNYGVASESCSPYTSGPSGKTGACVTTCADGTAYKKYKCQKGSAVHHLTVAGTKQEIYDNGPVEGAFTVYDDFYNYKSGIYHHVSGGVVGGHAIKVLGWGVESGVSYWICANSWGNAWGESGFFRIKMGDSGINQQIYTCKADLNTAFFFS